MERDDRLKNLRKRNVKAMNKLAGGKEVDILERFPARSLRMMLLIRKMHKAIKRAEKIHKELKERADLLDPNNKEEAEELREIVAMLDKLSEELSELDELTDEEPRGEDDLTDKEREEVLAIDKEKCIHACQDEQSLNDTFDEYSINLCLTQGYVSLLAFEIITKLPDEEDE